MQFHALAALALTVIGRCLAEPIPIDAMHRDNLVARTTDLRRFNNLPANNPNAFWPCLRCSVECAAVTGGCALACATGQVELCGLCIAGAGGSGACVECWPRCHGKGKTYDFINRTPRVGTA